MDVFTKTMDVFTKSIRKLMGWCPNAKTLETGSRIRFLSRFSSLFSRFDVRILLPAIFVTPFYINLLFRKGVNTEAFFLGLLLSLMIYLLSWKKQMQRYDALAKKPIVRSSKKKNILLVFLATLRELGFLCGETIFS